ncbi:MAG: TIGR04141 family sporadically distributed protein, partial [Bacteroidota bacterium]
QDDHYKESFSWVDLIAPVKDTAVIQALDGHLMTMLQSDERKNCWMAVPDIIDWEQMVGCRYSHRKTDAFAPGDLDLEEYLLANAMQDTDDIGYFKHHLITAWDSDNKLLHRWPAYRCLIAELALDEKLYVLSNSIWYSIENRFKRGIEHFFEHEVKASTMNWCAYSGESEGDYNWLLAEHLSGACLDAKNVSYGGGHSKIEVCDVLTPEKQLVHVKKYGGSYPLSHLFAQGLVASRTLSGDVEFRKGAKKAILHGKKHLFSRSNFHPRDWTVVYGILGRGKRQLPFFSKVNLKTATTNLRQLGYTVHLDFIPINPS